MNNIESELKDNPGYIDEIESIAEYEENNKCPNHSFIEGEDYDSCWTYKDVGVMPQKLYQMETRGLIDRVFDSNSTTSYSLIDRDKAKSVAEELSRQYNNDGAVEVNHSFPNDEQLEEIGVFDDVVGYEDAKWLLRKALSSDDIVNILLVGPPGCGKTVFLRCIDRLEGARFISGNKTTGSGFTDEMFERKPRYMCIDELDDMDNNNQKALSDYSEEGVLVETKGNDKRREMHTNTKTFAAANNTDNILDQIENRFTDLHFDPYTLKQFVKVCKRILPREFGHSEDHAEDIARAVWEIDGFANVRKAEDVASLSDGSDPEKVISVLENYSPDKTNSLLKN